MTAIMATTATMGTPRLSAPRLSAPRLSTAAESTAARNTAAQSTPRLRLTRRGRFVLTALAAGPLAALALSLALNGGVAAATSNLFSSSSLSAGSFDYVTVQAGQSLWALAESVAPTADPREVISEIVRLNQLENSELHPGDRIAIPLAYSR